MLSTPSRFRGHQVFGHLALQFDPSFFTFCHAYLAAYLIRRVFSHKKRITLVCIMPFRHSVEKDRKRILFGIEAPTFLGVYDSGCLKVLLRQVFLTGNTKLACLVRGLATKQWQILFNTVTSQDWETDEPRGVWSLDLGTGDGGAETCL